MNSRPRSIVVVQWFAVALVVLTIGVPIVALFAGNILSGNIAQNLTTIAVVFALSGVTLIGGLLALALSIAGVLLEWLYARREGRPFSSVARSPSALVLFTMLVLIVVFFLV